MALTKNDRDKIVSHARKNDYSWNSNGSKLTNGSGGTAKFSDTGKTVNVNGTSYSSAYTAKKSSRW